MVEYVKLEEYIKKEGQPPLWVRILLIVNLVVFIFSMIAMSCLNNKLMNAYTRLYDEYDDVYNAHEANTFISNAIITGTNKCANDGGYVSGIVIKEEGITVQCALFEGITNEEGGVQYPQKVNRPPVFIG